MSQFESQIPESPSQQIMQPLYQGESKSIFISFLELFFSRWILISGIFLSVTAWSYYALMRAPDTYEATGQVIIRRGAIQSVRSEPILRQEEEVGSELGIMLSIAVRNEAVSQLLAIAGSGMGTDGPEQPLIFGAFEKSSPDIDLDVTDLPTTDPSKLTKLLKDQIRPKTFGESNVVELSFISPNARFAASAVNTLINVYEKYHVTVGQNPGQSAFFQAEVERADVAINLVQDKLAKLLEDRNIADLKKERELVTLRRHALQVQLDGFQVDKVAVERDLQSMDGNIVALNVPFLRNDTSIKYLKSQLSQEQAQLEHLRGRYQASHPLVIGKMEEIAAIKARIVRERGLVIEQQQHLLQQITDKEAKVKSKIEELNRQLAVFPSLGMEINRLDRDIKQRILSRADIVEQMTKSSTLERTDESMNKVRVLGYAQVPPSPREARKAFKFAVAMLLSVIAAFVAAIFVEGFDHSIRRREEIEPQLQIPYLASLSSHPR